MALRKLCREAMAAAAAGGGRTSSAVAAALPDACPVKPYRDIPKVASSRAASGLKIAMNGGSGLLHEYCDQMHKKLGPIFRDHLGEGEEYVVVADRDLIQKVYNAEGQYPEHLVPSSWTEYNKKRGITRGLFFMDGPEWSAMRKTMNHSLLPREAVLKYSPEFNNVISDLLSRWEGLYERGITINIEDELYNWSIESLATMLFGRRLGAVQPAGGKSQLHEFVRHVQSIFQETADLHSSENHFRFWRLPNIKKRFEAAVDNALTLAHRYTEESIADIERRIAEGQEVSGVLSDLLKNKSFSREQITTTSNDLFIAGADTTTHTSQWSLLNLARYRLCAEEFLRHIRIVVPAGRMVTENDIDKIPYAMWVVKETLRMYPTASFLTRRVARPVVLDGYEVPKGTMVIMSQYTMGRDSESFSEPDRFKPERWDRETSKEHLSHGCMPFGVGARSCIGRRIAEMQMRLLLANAIQRFHIHDLNKQEVGIRLRMITAPSTPIKLLFEPRKQRDN